MQIPKTNYLSQWKEMDLLQVCSERVEWGLYYLNWFSTPANTPCLTYAYKYLVKHWIALKIQ